MSSHCRQEAMAASVQMAVFDILNQNITVVVGAPSVPVQVCMLQLCTLCMCNTSRTAIRMIIANLANILHQESMKF